MIQNQQKRVVLVVGLPGSGKTYYARQRALLENLHLVDDPKNISDVAQALEQHSQIIVCDPHLCREVARKSAAQFFANLGIVVEWVYFDNDLPACLANIARRQDQGDERIVQGFVRLMHKHFTIPENATVLPVWKATNILR